MPPRSVALVVFPGCQLLDVSGPASVFSAATEAPGARGYRVTLVSAKGGEIGTSCAVPIVTRAAVDVQPSSVDVLLMVGGSASGLTQLRKDHGMKKWVKEVAAQAERFGSVCTGAFAIADWGLADGKRVATHWAAASHLARRFPNVIVDPTPLYVVEGRLWTSAGVTAGIDMALAMVSADEGEGTAAAVARRLVLPLRRSGNQAQHSRMLEAQAGAEGRYADLITWIAANLEQPHFVPDLAARAGESERSFQRRFRKATGHSPAAFIAKLRLERARDLLSAGRSVKEAARACGFTSAELLSRAFRRAYGLAPSSLRAN